MTNQAIWTTTRSDLAKGRQEAISFVHARLYPKGQNVVKSHEFQAEEIFRKFGIPVPGGRVVSSVDEALEASRELNGPPWVVKAQIHTGGRGKGGGVNIVRTPQEAAEGSKKELARRLGISRTTLWRRLKEAGKD